MSRRPDLTQGANADVLAYLLRGPSFGKAIADEYGYAPSTVYLALKRLARDGHVQEVRAEGEPEPTGSRPRRYRRHPHPPVTPEPKMT